MSPLKIGILTTSDRAHAKVYDDVSGKEIIDILTAYLITPWLPVYVLVPDNEQDIIKSLINLCDVEQCCLVVTTGGTGPAPRDVTPEATEKVSEKILPGFGEIMRTESLKYVPTAILSRQTAGIRAKSLIINLPGKPASIRQCLQAVFPAVPYCIELIGGPTLQCNEDVIKTFRPK
ncbi:MAG: molybdopterin adenylyltransferase [Cytophagales bacterium]|nr:molybdopterin adenylyltransferase [Cytophagales bacterium]